VSTRSYRPVVDSLFGVVGDVPDGEFTVPIGGTVVAPGGQGSCGGTAATVDGALTAPEVAGVVVASPLFSCFPPWIQLKGWWRMPLENVQPRAS
jgi:hypothetical protein